MNNVTLIGNLTKDPELRYSTGGNQTAVCTFSIALNRGKDRDGNDRGADFPRVVVFGRMAENCDRFLSKGRKVAIQGHIHTDSYKDQEGRTIYTTDVIADRVEFLGGGQNQQEGRPPQPQYTPQPQYAPQPQQGYNQGYVPQGQTTPLPEQNAAPAGYTAMEDDDIPF